MEVVAISTKITYHGVYSVPKREKGIMLNALYVELNVFAALIMFIIMDHGKWRYMTLEQKLFNGTILSLIFVLLADAFTWLFNGVPGQWSYWLGWGLNSLYWLTCAIPGYLVMLYCMKKVGFPYFKQSIRIGVVVMILYWVSILLNLKSHLIFYVDSNNLYHRGEAFLIAGGLPLIFITASVLVCIYRIFCVEVHHRRAYCMFLSFMLIALVGSIPQVVVYGVVTIWISLAVALVACYVYLQNGSVSTDSLTGINNRRRFDRFTRYAWDNMKAPQDNMFLMILDINRFKQINDEFGHAEGDRALMLTADVLEEVLCDGKTFYARIGGDEFAVVFRNTEEELVKEKINRLHTTMADLCQEMELPYEITFATGYAKTDGETKLEFAKLFSRADENMYAHKATMRSFLIQSHIQSQMVSSTGQ